MKTLWNSSWTNCCASSFTIVVGVAIVAVQIVVPDADVRSGRSIAQGRPAYAAPEAVDVIEEPQTFDDHGRPSTQFLLAEGALLLPAHAEHPVVVVRGLGLLPDGHGLTGAQGRVTIVGRPLGRHLGSGPGRRAGRLDGLLDVHVISVVVVGCPQVAVARPLGHPLSQRVNDRVRKRGDGLFLLCRRGRMSGGPPGRLVGPSREERLGPGLLISLHGPSWRRHALHLIHRS